MSRDKPLGELDAFLEWVKRQSENAWARVEEPTLEGFRTIPLALPGPGRRFDPNRDLARLRARGAQYVLVTGAVTDRVLGARAEYPRETAFYEQLARRRPLYRLEPGDGREGPWVALYGI